MYGQHSEFWPESTGPIDNTVNTWNIIARCQTSCTDLSSVVSISMWHKVLSDYEGIRVRYQIFQIFSIGGHNPNDHVAIAKQACARQPTSVPTLHASSQSWYGQAAYTATQRPVTRRLQHVLPLGRLPP